MIDKDVTGLSELEEHVMGDIREPNGSFSRDESYINGNVQKHRLVKYTGLRKHEIDPYKLDLPILSQDDLSELLWKKAEDEAKLHEAESKLYKKAKQ